MGEPIAEVGYLAGLCGYTGTAWQKQNLQPGYHSQYFESFGGLVSGTTETFDATAVDEGYIIWLQCIEARNNSASGCEIFLIINIGGSQMIVAVEAGVTISIPVVWNGSIPMKKDDYVQVYVKAAVDGNAIECCCVGYKQQIAA